MLKNADSDFFVSLWRNHDYHVLSLFGMINSCLVGVFVCCIDCASMGSGAGKYAYLCRCLALLNFERLAIAATQGLNVISLASRR